MTLTAYFFSDVVKLTVHKKYCNPLKFMTHCISAELIPCKGGRDFVQICDMMSYFNVHAKADTSQVNLPNGTKRSKSAKNYSKSGLPHFYWSRHIMTVSLCFVNNCCDFCASVLWRCWLGGRKGIRPIKNWLVGCWRGYLCGADLHMAQLMPLPLTVSCSSKIQIGFAFLVRAHPGSPGKGPLNGCVCVCCDFWTAWSCIISQLKCCFFS